MLRDVVAPILVGGHDRSQPDDVDSQCQSSLLAPLTVDSAWVPLEENFNQLRKLWLPCILYFQQRWSHWLGTLIWNILLIFGSNNNCECNYHLLVLWVDVLISEHSIAQAEKKHNQSIPPLPMATIQEHQG